MGPQINIARVPSLIPTPVDNNDPYTPPPFIPKIVQIPDGLCVYIQNEPDISIAFKICSDLLQSDREGSIKRLELNYLGLQLEFTNALTLEDLKLAFVNASIVDDNVIDCRKLGWDYGWESAFRIEALSKITQKPLTYSFDGFWSTSEFNPGDTTEKLAHRHIRRYSTGA